MVARIQLRRTRGWRLPPNTVIVDRRSRWGNPFTAANVTGCSCNTCLVARFQGALTVAQLGDIRLCLRGKNLACWCHLSAVCHADALLELANDDATFLCAMRERGIDPKEVGRAVEARSATD